VKTVNFRRTLPLGFSLYISMGAGQDSPRINVRNESEIGANLLKLESGSQVGEWT
jgi:hypothetical protein